MRTRILVFAAIVVSATLIGAPLRARERAVEAPPIRLEFHSGLDIDQRPTADWQHALRHFHDADEIRQIAAERHPLTEEQVAWADLILSRLPAWQRQSSELAWPFGDIRVPSSLSILVGNVGASDAFVADDDTIAFDVRRLQEVYGDANKSANLDRINRFFDHELTHVLHRTWQRENGLQPESPLEEALWACLKEGLGHFRSFSSRWLLPDGSLTEHAEQALNRLAPIFVERMTALDTATPEEAEELTRNLSMGPFGEKWGALTIGLWLAQEAQRDPRSLAYWVEQGPWGVIELATRYLPAELAARLPAKNVQSRVH